MRTDPGGSRLHGFLPLLVAVLALVAIEAGLQARAQWLRGQSVFSMAAGEAMYRADPGTGLRLLAPSRTIRGTRMEVRTNSWGLRSAELSGPDRGPWIAVLGASSVQGLYAASNEQTASALLEQQLRSEGRRLRVVNAGVAGLTISEQVRLLTRRLIPAGVQSVYWYPGSNDIGCARPAPAAAEGSSWHLPEIGLPRWTLSRDLIVKNTGFLRPPTQVSALQGSPRLDVGRVAGALSEGMQAAREAGVELKMVTLATAFAPGQPESVQSLHAATALHFRPCFTAPTLLAAVGELNAVIRAVAERHGVPVVEAAQAMTGQEAWFGDASHFSVEGELKFSHLLADDYLHPAGRPATAVH